MKDASDIKTSTVGGPAMFHGEPRTAYVIDETDTVDRFFPRMVKLTLPDHTQRIFQPGLQSVPKELADHPWLVDNGVIELKSKSPLPPMVQPAVPGTQAYAASIGNSGVYDATLVPNARVSSHELRAIEAVAVAAAENARQARENLENAERVSQNANAAVADVRARLQSQRSGPEDEVVDHQDVETNAGDDADEARAARVANLTAKMREDYDLLTTDEERDAFLTAKGR